MKESISRAFSHLLANKSAFGVARDVDTSDFHVEVIDLLGNKVGAELGAALPLQVAVDNGVKCALIPTDIDADMLEEKLAKARSVKQGMMQEVLTGRIRFV